MASFINIYCDESRHTSDFPADETYLEKMREESALMETKKPQS